MQRLVWQNSNGDEINLTSGNYGITNWEGFANTSLNIQSQQVPFQDGGVFLDALMEQRELSVTLAMYDGGNLETRYRLRRELMHILNPKLGEGYLIYTNDFISKRIKCVAQIPLFETHNSNNSGTPKASLTWTASEPYWEDLEESEISFDISQQPIIKNEGDVPCQIEMDWYTNGIVNGKVTNLTQNQKIQYDGELTESLKINTNYGKKSVVTEKNVISLSNIGFRINDVVYSENLGIFVFVGNSNEIVTSRDLKNYKVSLINENDLTLYGVCCSETLNLFVAIGEKINYESGINEGKLYTSSDGITWTERTIPNISSLEAVVYSNHLNLFVAVGNKIITSSDGITWTERKAGVNLTDICYSETIGIFIANEYYSEDGINWTDSGNTLGKTIVSEKLGIFVSITDAGGGGTTGVIKTSSDGITWTERTITGITQSEWIATISYSETLQLFVLLTNYQSGYYTSENIYTSTDGINWVRVKSINMGSVVENSIYANGFNVFLSIGQDSLILKSYNGTDWEECILGSNYADQYNGICFSESLSRFVAVGEKEGSYPRAICSEDGNDWSTLRNTISYRILKNATYSEKLKLFVMIGDDGDVLLSQNGLNFSSQIKVTPQANLNGIVFADNLNLFVIVGSNPSEYGSIFTSQDGNNWVHRISGVDVVFYGVTYSNRLNSLVAVGENGAIITSSDGITWVERTSGVNENLYSVSYSESQNIFVTVGTNGCVLTSFDGITWVERTSGVTEDLNSICYAKSLGLFMAVGNNGTILISSDGLNWTNQESGVTENLKGVTFGNKINRFVIVGENAIIMYTEFQADKNRIDKLSADSNMNMSLGLGNNQFRINRTSGNMTVRIKYRQKYIGV